MEKPRTIGTICLSCGDEMEDEFASCSCDGFEDGFEVERSPGDPEEHD